MDWRDLYPGINVVTLMELADPPERRRTALMPVVRFAVERSLGCTSSAAEGRDRWTNATALELAVLADDPEGGAGQP